jgi:hypothetical protein
MIISPTFSQPFYYNYAGMLNGSQLAQRRADESSVMTRTNGRALYLIAALLFALADRAANGGELAIPRLSGLPWVSGVGLSYRSFEQWRGRSADVYVTWHPHRTWAEIEEANAVVVRDRLHRSPGRLSMGIAMLPRTHAGQFKACAAGEFDHHYETVAERLVEWGRADAILRIGWEANSRRKSVPWGIEGEIALYIACFRQIVSIMRAVSPTFVIEWTMKKGTEGLEGRPVTDAWPGDEVVDLVGVDYYDGYPSYTSIDSWNTDYVAQYDGGPRGLGTWLEFAKSRGKRLAIPEWAIRNRPGAGEDNPFYIDRMVAFFRRHARDLAYEAYFNPASPRSAKVFSLEPATNNPRAAAEYLRLYADPNSKGGHLVQDR